MWLSMRPTPSMLDWSCPHLTFAKSYQGLGPFPFDLLYLSFKLNLFVFMDPEIWFGYLFILVVFFCSKYGRVFSSFHQRYSLCICKRLAIPKVLFSNFTNLLPAPIFWPWLCVSCPKSLRGAVWWLSTGTGCWGGFGCARALAETPTNQPTNQLTNPARSCSRVDKQQHIWRAAQEETNWFEPKTCKMGSSLRI